MSTRSGTKFLKKEKKQSKTKTKHESKWFDTTLIVICFDIKVGVGSLSLLLSHQNSIIIFQYIIIQVAWKNPTLLHRDVHRHSEGLLLNLEKGHLVMLRP